MQNIYKSIIALCVCFLFSENTLAFLWQDNGLELYKNIDQWLYELDSYELLNEISGAQWGSVSEQSAAIFERNSTLCNPTSSEDILALSDHENLVSSTIELCENTQGSYAVDYFERVHNSAKFLKNSAASRARLKIDQSYDIAAIWIYSDGSTDNSPFDLMVDLQEIDAVIFTKKLEYKWSSQLFWKDFGIGGILPFSPKSSSESSNEKSPRDILTGVSGRENDTEISELPEFVDDIIGHHPVCADYENAGGISDGDFNKVIADIIWENLTQEPKTQSLVSWINDNPNTTQENGNSVATTWTQSGSYAPIYDIWDCNNFICITVNFKMKRYGLIWGNSFALENILQRVAKHLDKTSNTSLTQKKMTTNNFEISSILTNLPGVLRGLTIHTETRPIPILDLPEDEEVIQWNEYTKDSLLAAYYSNLWLDYSRRNDVQIFTKWNEKLKALQTAWDLPIWYSEERINELRRLSDEYAENNRRLQASVRAHVEHETLSAFDEQFTELERFTAAMADFSDTIKWAFLLFEKIPTRRW